MQKINEPCPVFDKEDLDQLTSQGCQSEGCRHEHDNGPMVFTSLCHEGKGTDTFYIRDLGIIVIVCRRCKKKVMAIRVGHHEMSSFSRN
jgi:hypothetical protein